MYSCIKKKNLEKKCMFIKNSFKYKVKKIIVYYFMEYIFIRYFKLMVFINCNRNVKFIEVMY